MYFVFLSFTPFLSKKRLKWVIQDSFKFGFARESGILKPDLEK